MDLVEGVYLATRQYPADERYGLVAQMRRASVSIPSNIAEGHGRKATQAYINHLSIATGSLMELETQLQIASRLGYTTAKDAEPLMKSAEEIGKMLAGLKNSLNPQS